MTDQRTNRCLAIGSVDLKKTNEFKRKLERKIKRASYKKQCTVKLEYEENVDHFSEGSNSSDNPDSQEFCEPSTSNQPESSKSQSRLISRILLHLVNASAFHMQRQLP